MQEVTFGVSDFVAVFNQTITNAYPQVTIVGELANFKISKNRWIYFDLKDEMSSVRFFGTVYHLQTPLEEGMVLTVSGVPQLHPQFGFSINVRSIQLSGEGTIKRAAQLLEAKLRKEGLFDEARKQLLPYPPSTIGLITSSESAAYADFMKILDERWGGVGIQLFDVQVQGEAAPDQIVEAIEYFNKQINPPDVLVITRGGGSPDDLQAFSAENVVRAVSASHIPTMVAIGHEIDISLAELAADMRASTPSNAAQLLVPSRHDIQQQLLAGTKELQANLLKLFGDEQFEIKEKLLAITHATTSLLQAQQQYVKNAVQLLQLLHPEAILKRGYAIVRVNGKVVRSVKKIAPNSDLTIQLADGTIKAKGKVQ